MADTAWSGPLLAYANLGLLATAAFGFTVPDPDINAGPCLFYQGDGVLDPRQFFEKDQVVGRIGKVMAHYDAPFFETCNVIPSAASATNIAAAQNATNGTPLTLVSANAYGVNINIPIHPFVMNGVMQEAPIVTPGVILDFGFTFGATTAGNSTITVPDTTMFSLGMPLVIAGVGNSGATLPLFCYVTAILTATTITVSAPPQATSTGTAIGAGDYWGPSVGASSTAWFSTPTAAFPFVAAGPGLYLDPRQAIMRGVRITGSTSATGGNFLVSGYDAYGMQMSQLVTVGAGAVAGYSLKTFKSIVSVTPQFTDAHTYSVGTSDLFGFAYRALFWEETDVCYAAVLMTGGTGFVAGVETAASSTTGDVRGTVQASTTGPGSSISGGSATNGALAGTTVTGNRLFMGQFLSPANIALATNTSPQTMFGNTQA